MTSKTRLLAVFMLALALMVACGGSASAKRSDVYGKVVRMPNGEQVSCVVAETAQGTGISCRW
jgi:hypothetical protein